MVKRDTVARCRFLNNKERHTQTQSKPRPFARWLPGMAGFGSSRTGPV
jgi:hypothetical protein